MKISKIQGCCSMIMVNNNPDFKYTDKIKFKADLLHLIDSYNLDNPNNIIHRENIKAVQMITNSDFSDRLAMWFEGFRKIGSYKGNSHAKAHIMLMRTPKGL